VAAKVAAERIEVLAIVADVLQLRSAVIAESCALCDFTLAI
jgi:hypothetical protein